MDILSPLPVEDKNMQDIEHNFQFVSGLARRALLSVGQISRSVFTILVITLVHYIRSCFTTKLFFKQPSNYVFLKFPTGCLLNYASVCLLSANSGHSSFHKRMRFIVTCDNVPLLLEISLMYII